MKIYSVVYYEHLFTLRQRVAQKLIRYVRIHFQVWSGTASLRLRLETEPKTANAFGVTRRKVSKIARKL